MRKKLISALLVVCMVLALLPASALAANTDTPPTSGTCGDGLTWTYEPVLDEDGIDTGGTLTIRGNGAMENYITDIAPWSDHYIVKIKIETGVTTIGDNAFSLCGQLMTVSIPNSVSSIGYGAFQNCSNLTSVHIPDNVTAIGDHAFMACWALANVSIPKKIESIGAYAFSGCMKLENIDLPNGLLEIKNSAFSGTALTRVSIPASVIRMDGTDGIANINNAFSSCDKLTEITVDSNNKVYSSYEGSLLNKDGSKFYLCPGGKTSCKIPMGVTYIMKDSFAFCEKLTSVEIPNSVTKIGDSAFSGCAKLTDITLPSSLTQIEGSAFRWCTSLTHMVIPGSVTNIGFYAFCGCNHLTDLVISEGVTNIFGGAFSSCSNLSTISMPTSLSTIWEDAFANCIGIKTINYAGTEAQWNAIEKDGNQELDLAKITFNSTSTPTPPINPDTPSTPGNLTLSKSTGGLGTKVTTQVTGGHWLTVQVSRAGAISITAIQAPGSGGMVSVSFSAPAGSAVQVWETENELTFTDGVPNGVILNKGTIDL